MAATPINPLSRPASSILGFDANPADELQRQLAERKKKVMQAAQMRASASDLLTAPNAGY